MAISDFIYPRTCSLSFVCTEESSGEGRSPLLTGAELWREKVVISTAGTFRKQKQLEEFASDTNGQLLNT